MWHGQLRGSGSFFIPPPRTAQKKSHIKSRLVSIRTVFSSDFFFGLFYRIVRTLIIKETVSSLQLTNSVASVHLLWKTVEINTKGMEALIYHLG